MSQASLWKSILGARKALTAGAAVLITFVSATLANNGGRNLTGRQWIAAAAAFVVAHMLTYLVSNEGSLPIGRVLSALVSNPTVTAALTALGVDPALISPLVEPTAVPTPASPPPPPPTSAPPPAPPPPAPEDPLTPPEPIPDHVVAAALPQAAAEVPSVPQVALAEPPGSADTPDEVLAAAAPGSELIYDPVSIDPAASVTN